MTEFVKGPWEVTEQTQNVCAVNSPENGGNIVCQAPRGFIASLVYWEANARLIARAPSMLALLEKALPIIEEEAERRSFSYSPKQETDSYWSEMRDLADEISAEIDKAYGRETSKSDPELFPHGFGFVEYCPDCKSLPDEDPDDDDYDYATDDRNFDAARERRS